MGYGRRLTPLLAWILLPLCDARSVQTKWSDEPNTDGALLDFQGNNGAFFYPDQEYFERDDFDSISSSSEDDSSDYDDSQFYDDYSGWADSDDEDFELEQQNFIPVIPRGRDFHDRTAGGKGYYKYNIDPDTAINSGYVLPDLEEEHFGNELHDFDKLAELTQRVTDMQDQLKLLRRLVVAQQNQPQQQPQQRQPEPRFYRRRRLD